MKNFKEHFSKIGLDIVNEELYSQAFIHPSYKNVLKIDYDNQRMEFFGDAILDLVVSEYLYFHESRDEGALTQIRASFVNENMLYKFAKKIELDKFIKTSKGVDPSKISTMADAFEAFVCAIYLDRGYDVLKKFIIDNFEKELKISMQNYDLNDYKTKLQEYLQKNSVNDFRYELINSSGPDHNKSFEVGFYVEDKLISKGIGTSKKRAQQEAARVALNRLG